MTERVRIALISDLHANEIALREVLRSIERQGADEVVCLGDVATLGIAPAEVIDILRRLGCRCIKGNHDDYLLDAELVDPHLESQMIVEAIDWCRDQISPDQLEFLRGFEDWIELALGRDVSALLYHGSPTSNTVDLLSETPAELFDEQLGPRRATVMAGGHTHVQMVRPHRGSLVVNPGSVGAPFREFPNGGRPTILGHAEYATIEVRDGDVGVTLHRVALDRHELARAALASPIPMRSALASHYL